MAPWRRRRESASSPGVKSPASSRDRPGIGDDDGGDECGAPPGKQCLACRRVTGTDSSSTALDSHLHGCIPMGALGSARTVEVCTGPCIR